MTTTSVRTIDNYVAGEWVRASDPTDVLDVTTPASGEVLARVPLSGRADLDRAVTSSAMQKPPIPPPSPMTIVSSPS